MNILLILQGLNAALAMAPTAVEVATKAKELVSALFSAKAITVAQQNAIHAHVDSTAALVAAGIIPAHWAVEADPILPLGTVSTGIKAWQQARQPEAPPAPQ